MINLLLKFIRGNFEYFLGRLNNVFYEEAKCPSIILIFVRTFCVNLPVFNRFKQELKHFVDQLGRAH